MGPFLSAADAAVLTDELAEYIIRTNHEALAPGSQGWWDDSYGLIRPWGFAAGLHLGRHDDPWWQCLPFVALTLLLLAVPAIAVTLLGKRAHTTLPRISDWMTQHGWIVNEIVLAFFAAIIINSLVSGN